MSGTVSTRCALLLAGICLVLTSSAADTELPDQATLRTWVAQMKESPRGPFSRIRWFCNDGTVLPPVPYGCRDHGGGSQHGEWNERVKLLRAHGYFIANVYADLDADALARQSGHWDVVAQMLLERYLISIDNGWILRKARFYRGALQEEGERRGARRLLNKLAEDRRWISQRYYLLRQGVAVIRHGPETTSVTEVRRLSTALANQAPEFQRLRNKIHVSPDAGDAALVRAWSATNEDPTLVTQSLRLAAAIDAVYTSESLPETLDALADKTKGSGDLHQVLRDASRQLALASSPEQRFVASAVLMAALRRRIVVPNGPTLRIALLSASRQVEDEHFAAATEVRKQLPTATRRQRLAWTRASIDAIYGAGLLSERQLRAAHDALNRLSADHVRLDVYKESLDYLALIPAWSSQRLRFHFGEAVERLAVIEPLVHTAPQDMLRGTPVFFYGSLMNALLQDANRLARVRKDFFGEEVGVGLRALNPGLARGTLTLALDGHSRGFKPDGIYVLPETVADLPPVAGILTAGEGNPLSHVQLLARNLGIPNVVVGQSLIARLQQWEGRSVLLAVSAAGSVRLTEDLGEAQRSPGDPRSPAADIVIEPDLKKLDLKRHDFTPLASLRAVDAGRSVGPKAAKLGELRHHYPEAVAEGLTVPFGAFRRLLDRPYNESGQSMFEWMTLQYQLLARMPLDSKSRADATETLRTELHAWIQGAELENAFRVRLKAAMEETFGADGSYGVFVRSDTNVEDLPGFTGAGLNLTVPNVVGFDNVLAAISRVWASPFTSRAYAWRQSRMSLPQHVYPAVLLLKSVPAEKSGVLVTRDIESGDPGWLTVVVNEGVGGAVDGQAAESLRIHLASGRVRLMAQATTPWRRALRSAGGTAKLPVSGKDTVLEPNEIRALITLARELPRRFPPIVDADGNPAPADIEFGFLDGQLALFQIRPFLESSRARQSRYLKSLDAGLRDMTRVTVDLNRTRE